jgi:hypothetical protein
MDAEVSEPKQALPMTGIDAWIPHSGFDIRIKPYTESDQERAEVAARRGFFGQCAALVAAAVMPERVYSFGTAGCVEVNVLAHDFIQGGVPELHTRCVPIGQLRSGIPLAVMNVDHKAIMQMWLYGDTRDLVGLSPMVSYLGNGSVVMQA